MKAKASLLPPAELALAMVLAGSHVVIGRLAIRTFPVLFTSGLTLAAAALVFLALCLLKERRVAVPGGRDLALLALQSFIGIFLYRIFLLHGIGRTGAIEGGIVLSTTPAFLGLASFLFLGEKASRLKVAAILLAFLGILALNLAGRSGGRPPGGFLLGTLLLFGAVAGDVLLTVVRKAVAGRVPLLANAVWVSGFAALLFLPFVLAESGSVLRSIPPPLHWAALFYYGTFVPVLFFLLWFHGVDRVPVSLAGVFTGVLPVSTLLFSRVLLGETIRWTHLAGTGLVLAGIFLAVRRSSPDFRNEGAPS